jgi:hypothetical protein
MAYYAEKDFFADDKLIELVTGILNGNLTLEWFDVETARLQAKPADPARGLTYQDCNLGPYGYDAIPELVRNRNSMASRGSVLVPKLPDLGYTINRKSDVWCDDVCTLYEEAKSRRWAPAVDVPWPELRASPDPLREAAVAQLCTLLEEVALVAAEAPARWVFVINQEFLELKSFLCVQMFDEARHVEACRKRALASGHGLGHASVSAEQALKELLSAETYPEASLATNVLLGSFALAMYRAARAHAGGSLARDALDAGCRALRGLWRRTHAVPRAAPAREGERTERVPRSHRAHGGRDRRQHGMAGAADRPRGRVARALRAGTRQRVRPSLVLADGLGVPRALSRRGTR